MPRLAQDVFIAPVGEAAVLLDLSRDRYYALSPKLAAATLALLGRAPPGQSPPADQLAKAQARLCADGLLTAGTAGDDGGAVQAPLAKATLWPSATPAPPRLVHRLSVHAALAQTWMSLRLSRFSQTIAWVRRSGSLELRAATSAQTLLDAYFTERPWFPAAPICRLDALALFLHLRRHGCEAELVFGAALGPFAAHCWVQSGDQVINEPHEVAALYTPILAIGRT